MSQPYAGLTPDTVIDCIEQIGYRCDLRLLVLNSYENRVYQVGIEDETPVIAKFYREGRWTDTQILEEHEFALDLQSHGLSVVAPLVVNGATLHHAMGHRFSVFPRRGGHPPELDNLDHLLSLGRTLARIHRVGATLTRYHGVLAPNHRWCGLVTPASRGKGIKSISNAEVRTPAERHAAMTWAQRLKRVFNIDIDIEVCSLCGGSVRVIACIEDQDVIDRILTHLRQKEQETTTRPLLVPPTRAPPGTR